MRRTFLAIFTLLIALTAVRAFLVRSSNAAGIVWITDDNPTRRGQMAGFTEATGEPIRIDPTNGGVEKVIVQSIGGVGPDIFDCGSASQLSAFVRAGVALDVEEDLKKIGIDVKADAYRGTFGQAVYQGKVYGVPTNITADGIWFHEDLIPASQVPTSVGSWDDFAKFAQKFMRRDAQGRITQYAFLFEWWNWKHFVYSCGGKLFDDSGETCLINQPNAIRGIQVMHDLVYKYKITPTPSEEAAMTTQGGWGSGSISYFGAKRGVMGLGGRWWMASLSQYKGLKLNVMEGPLENGGAPRAYGRATLINRDSPRKKEAFEFLKYLASKKYNDIVDRDSDGTPAFRKFANQNGTNKTWTHLAAISLPDQSSPYIDGSQVERIITKQLDLVKGNVKSPTDAMKSAANEINRIIRENRGLK